MTKIGFVKGVGIYYKSELRTIRKKKDRFLQPIFEAFTNSLEAIRTKYADRELSLSKNDEIAIKIYHTKNLLSKESNDYDFDKITISDTGIGLNDTEYERLVNLRDDRKNFSNKGTGRVQFIHAFSQTNIKSTYADEKSSTGYMQRDVTLSKSEAFLKNNTIIRLNSINEVEGNGSKTIVTFKTVLDPKDEEQYKDLTALQIKDELIRHYLAGFCENRNNLPQIKIIAVIDDEIKEELEIVSEDIPVPQKEKPIKIYYSRVNDNVIEKSSKNETFNLKAFLIDKTKLKNNGLKLVSKGEIAKGIILDNLSPTDHINGKRYLFLLSGPYIDNRDADTRGKINLITGKELKENSGSLFDSEEILIEDIEDTTNQTITSLFEEIGEKQKEKENNIKELQEMFLLNDKAIHSLKNKIKIGDSDETILRKVYEVDMKLVAKKDAEIKRQIKDLETLDPNNKDYQKQLSQKVNQFVKDIPQQNRTALTQYVARRKMVIELFDKILHNELNKLKNGERIDEDLLHNLVFQKHADEPQKSDLWLINEEFIYFKGTSECQLGKLELNGNKVLKERLTDEEKEYQLKQQGDAKQKRTDILLFPNEGKCIIIELKAPDINISEHLNQINRYASLINNLSKKIYKFNTFYGYLIGENIDIDDIEDNDTDFKSAHGLRYIFRPYKRIAGKFGKQDGSLYTEIINYSTLLDRAKLRNQIFIDKLEGNLQAIQPNF